MTVPVCHGCGHAHADHSPGLSLSPFAALRCTVEGCGCWHFRAPADRDSDAENYDADRCEALVGDMYSSEWPETSLRLRAPNVAGLTLPATPAGLTHQPASPVQRGGEPSSRRRATGASERKSARRSPGA